MRLQTLLFSLLLGMATCAPAVAQVGISIGLPGVSIGINLPVYPELVAVPGYPVYYAPQLEANFFFYDGLYWVYGQDRWYASRWYNGPWDMVEPNVVPMFVLRIPVRYYRRPPQYFGGWSRDAPPRWGDHWGHDWERQHGGWDQWNHGAAPAPAPLPTYQRQYSRDRYPSADQQQQLHQQNYRYQPHEEVVRQRWYQQPSGQAAAAQHPASAQQHDRPPQATPAQKPAPEHQQDASREAAPAQHPAPAQQQGRPPQAAAAQHPAPDHQQSAPRETAPTQQQGRPPQEPPTNHPAPEQHAEPHPPQGGQSADKHSPQAHPQQPQSEHGGQPEHDQPGAEDKGKDKKEPH